MFEIPQSTKQENKVSAQISRVRVCQYESGRLLIRQTMVAARTGSTQWLHAETVT